MPLRQGPLDGLWISERRTHSDDRGFFREAFRLSELAELLDPAPIFVQANHSRSYRSVLRGLHAENWEKLVYVPRGEVMTALADVRPDSPTFGRAATFLLGENHPLSLFVPRGLAHGYYVLSDEADYVYQVTAYYDGSDTRAVAWDDPDLAIDWPTRSPILSERDKQNPTLRQLFPEQWMVSMPTLVGGAAR
jgi:dTDP-4-dehydrorhamnose 3,5-epimerase